MFILEWIQNLFVYTLVRGRAGNNIYYNIEVGTGTWIGANVLVLLGVHMGPNNIKYF